VIDRQHLAEVFCQIAHFDHRHGLILIEEAGEGKMALYIFTPPGQKQANLARFLHYSVRQAKQGSASLRSSVMV
jgi:hypothetical protein